MAECFTVEVARNASHIDGSLLKRPWLIHLLDLEWNGTEQKTCANDFFSSSVVDSKSETRKCFPFYFSVSSPQQRYSTDGGTSR